MLKRLNKFNKEETGAVAVTFGVSVVVIAAAVGVAVDLASAVNARGQLQAAADAAVLAGTLSKKESLEEKREEADLVFFANLENADFDFPVTGKLDEAADGIGYVYNASSAVMTDFGKLAGINSVDVDVTAEAASRKLGLELAFAFDSTNSTGFADQADLAALINDTLETLQSQARDDDFHVTFIPFSDRVKLGDQLNPNQILAEAAPPGWNGCVEPRETPEPGFPHAVDAERPDDVLSRFYPSGGTYSTPTPWNGCLDQGIIGPTTDIDEIQDYLEDASKTGSGRFDTALAWAWRALSPNWQGLWGVSGYPADTSNDLRKVAVLITDGRHNLPRWELGGSGGNVAPTDYGDNYGSEVAFEHLENVCSKMKADGIDIHIIYSDGNPYSVDHFKNCVNEPGFFHEVENLTDFEMALASIMPSDIEPRLTK